MTSPSSPLPNETGLEITIHVPVKMWGRNLKELRTAWRDLKDSGASMDAFDYGFEIQTEKVKWGEIKEASRG